MSALSFTFEPQSKSRHYLELQTKLHLLNSSNT